MGAKGSSLQGVAAPEFSLRKLIRDHNPLHRQERIPLEATVEKFFEGMKTTSLFQTQPHLFLELKGPDSAYMYSGHYSTLPFNLNLPLVREVYDMLKQEKKARFNGYLTIYTDWALIPPTKAQTGELVGELSLDSKSYSVRFISSRVTGPMLKYIHPS